MTGDQVSAAKKLTYLVRLLSEERLMPQLPIAVPVNAGCSWVAVSTWVVDSVNYVESKLDVCLVLDLRWDMQQDNSQSYTTLSRPSSPVVSTSIKAIFFHFHALIFRCSGLTGVAEGEAIRTGSEGLAEAGGLP